MQRRRDVPRGAESRNALKPGINMKRLSSTMAGRQDSQFIDSNITAEFQPKTWSQRIRYCGAQKRADNRGQFAATPVTLVLVVVQMQYICTGNVAVAPEGFAMCFPIVIQERRGISQ